jgi:hypothetical protein
MSTVAACYTMTAVWLVWENAAARTTCGSLLHLSDPRPSRNRSLEYMLHVRGVDSLALTLFGPVSCVSEGIRPILR